MAKKILHVDDEPEWLSMVATSLQAAGHEVVSAKDASEGMSKAEGTQLGLIILDANLAGEDGLVLMKFLRKNHPEVPILIYTGLEHDEAAIKTMLQHGATDYLRKGTMDELIVVASSYCK